MAEDMYGLAREVLVLEVVAAPRQGQPGDHEAADDVASTRDHSLKLNKRRSNKDLRLHFFSEKVVNR